MKAWLPLTLAVVLASTAHAQAGCSYPKAPEAVPDGNTATKEQMVAASQDFKRYNTEMNAYLDCIKLEIDTSKPADPSKLSPDERKKAEAQQKQLTQKNNAAVDELSANVARFNAQLRAYKAKNK